MRIGKWIVIGCWLWVMVGTALAQTLDNPFPIPAGTIEGNINDTFFTTFYSFDVVTDDVVTITMANTSGDLDPFLNLYNLSGEILDFNDDVDDGASRNAQITLTADTDETLIIEATRFDRDEGTTTGTYSLTLNIESALQAPVEVDPLTLEPPFAVDYTIIEYEALDTTGVLDGVDLPEQYFAFVGYQGDFIRAITTITDGDLMPVVTIRNADSTVISTSQTVDNETTTLATIPEDGWYLVEVKQESGVGQFRLFVEQLAQSVIVPDQPISGTLTDAVPTLSYVFDGTINDTVLASVELLDYTADDPVKPEIAILDLNQEVIGSFPSKSDRASVLVELPRSGAYIIQVSTSGTQAGGNIVVDLQQSEFGTDKLNIREARYNESYKGIVSNGIPVQYFRFVGKVGELVTIDMRADDTMVLDPFLILLDSDLNELAFNDTVGNSANARITQFSLPDNGDYYIIASRAGLEAGTSEGRYTLSLTVGRIELQTGNFSASLSWTGTADLNLFVREPSGRVLSWSTPNTPAGGELQIDSNTNCETPTSQPIEHIVFPNSVTAPTGDYTIWVWYQDGCGMDTPVPFTLTVNAYNQELLKLENTPENPLTISPNQRLETVVRLNENNATVINRGEFSSPTPQINASQGGDTLIRYGETVSDTIRNDVYARFYQFMGEPNDRVVITVETQTGNLDPIVVLRTADDVNLAQNDDATPTTRNSRLEFTLDSAGQYVIAVTRYGLRDGTTTGSYNLTIERETGD